MKRTHYPTLIGITGIAGGLMILFVFPVGKVEPAIPTIKVPGPYPYETPVRVPAPAISESSPSLSAAPDRDSRTVNARRPPTVKAVREAAFKYNGVSDFCEFLSALPADVSVFDPKLGITRTLVKGGHVIRENVAWFRKRKEARLKSNDRTVVSVEQLGTQSSAN